MTKYDVLDIIAKEHLVERVIFKLLPASKNRFDYPDDLVQDIYLLLLEKEEDLIVNLFNKGEIGFYILKIARNQLLSANSPYYCMYIKFGVKSDGLEKAAHITTEDNR